MRHSHERRATALAESDRLALILEAVRYCQRAKALGMPPSCYTKALREPIYFLWECRDGLSKQCRPQFRSRESLGVRFGSGTLVYDHAIPFRYLQEDLLALEDPTEHSVAEGLNRYGVIVLITKDEDRRVSKAGYNSRMPQGWDGVDPFARYKAVGIEVLPNPEHVGGSAKNKVSRRLPCLDSLSTKC